VSISPVTDGTGELVNFVGVQNDVTERVMVEQERRAGPRWRRPRSRGPSCGCSPKRPPR
jgi:hypothetical protein